MKLMTWPGCSGRLNHDGFADKEKKGMECSSLLRIPAKMHNLELVFQFINSVLREYLESEREQALIRIAIEEMFVNIVFYAYPDKTGWVEIRGQVEDHIASFTLIDNGIPFNPLEKPDPDVMLSAQERQIGGLGIYMVKKRMDSVEYEYKDGCNILTLRKHV